MLAVFNCIERFIASYDKKTAPWLTTSLARFVFAASLAVYYWKSAMTKLGDGLFSLSDGAYAQIFPRTMEEVGYNVQKLSILHDLIVLGATYGEFVLPFLIVVGLLTRLAAVGMIVFIMVQSFVDIVGHGISRTAIGFWFDRVPDSVILDQRLFWVFVLIIIFVKGAGPVSVDQLLMRVGSKSAS